MRMGGGELTAVVEVGVVEVVRVVLVVGVVVVVVVVVVVGLLASGPAAASSERVRRSNFLDTQQEIVPSAHPHHNKGSSRWVKERRKRQGSEKVVVTSFSIR